MRGQILPNVSSVLTLVGYITNQYYDIVSCYRNSFRKAQATSNCSTLLICKVVHSSFICSQSPIIDINNREHPTELRQIKILEIEIKSKSLENDFKSNHALMYPRQIKSILCQRYQLLTSHVTYVVGNRVPQLPQI